MAETEVLFPIRGQLFGGFDRQDVISYISKSNAEKLETQRERDRAINEAEELRDKYNALQEELEYLRAELQNRDEENERLTQDSGTAAEKLSSLNAELESVREELNTKRQAELTAAVEAVRELKESFELVKGLVTSRTATLKKELTLAEGELDSMNAIMAEAEGRIDTLLDNIAKEQNRVE